ncbi:MFS transporter [Halopseudomonas pelagia]|uniref:MFS transporter n=1 Tax=Halopseudomonas pelagia TaxID=553151 RepID=A0AA91U4P6_9GAMM|nr:MFS transporter [Halopseudomonas pelagia]PCD00735.1 MFS transporter [Halopseudomonas pelagia]QFY56974.1 MFS transporter [Halopseudomonas pelagia]
MFNESEYQTMWMIYLAAAACAWLVWWKMTSWIPFWYVREPLWLIMAILLFTPVRVDPMESWMAPATMIFLLDTVLDTGDNEARMLGDLALAMGLALLLYLLIAAGRAGWKHWRQQETAHAKGHYKAP